MYRSGVRIKVVLRREFLGALLFGCFIARGVRLKWRGRVGIGFIGVGDLG